MNSEACLIIEQFATAPAEMPEILGALSSRHNLDSYNCRQRLLGQGQSLLTKGPLEEMESARKTLAEFGIQGYALIPSKPTFAPFNLARIEPLSDSLKFHGRDKLLKILRGSNLLILLSDISGELAERNLGQLLSAHRYRGVTENAGLPEAKWQRAILQGKPVVDIYLLDEAGEPQAAVRALPGKFDHRGLGDLASLSSSQNLLKLIELARGYASRYRIDMRFGLSPLPGARLNPAKDDDVDGLLMNLRSLTRYGWLQADIDRQRAAQPDETSDQTDLMAAASTLLAAANPELIAGHPLHQQVMAEMKEAALEEKSKGSPGRTAQPSLPTPPDVQRHNVLFSPKALFGYVLFAIIALMTNLDPGIDWVLPIIAKAATSGVLSALFATGLFYLGFQRLRLKRIIENTPTSKIRSIAMGFVEVHGTARRKYALVSPMTQIACIYYRLTRYKRNHKNNWVVSSIISSGHVPFWLEDETGRISIDPRTAEVSAGHRQESIGEDSVAFGGFSSSGEKWVEEIIYDGALVYVLGEARVDKSAQTPRSQRRAEALKQLKQDKQRMAGYDINGDGHIDEGEWQLARDAIDDQLIQEDLTTSSERKRQEEMVVIGKPRHRGVPFVIAETATQENLTSGYTLALTFIFTAALICSALTCWILLKNFQAYP